MKKQHDKFEKIWPKCEPLDWSQGVPTTLPTNKADGSQR